MMPRGTYVSMLSWMNKEVSVCSRFENEASSTSLRLDLESFSCAMDILARSQLGRRVRSGWREEREREWRWWPTRPSRRVTSSRPTLGRRSRMRIRRKSRTRSRMRSNKLKRRRNRRRSSKLEKRRKQEE